ncbi:MAG: cytochrome c biogenesis protein CcsA [Phycisphaerae bacterium]|nr:cytochrome c biogenesis protein CcsA [Phycisphaerae bacterium]
MADLGNFALQLALFITAYAIIADLAGAWLKEPALMRSGRNATVACWLAISTAVGALLYALTTCDFSIQYVVENVSKKLPIEYKISALWAGAAGSLLVWLWLQLTMVIWTFNRTKVKDYPFVAIARVMANIVSVFFLVVLLFDENKKVFEVLKLPPLDGHDLNPLLQHPAMVLHPPALFVGYAAYLIPFCWILAAMVDKRKTVRPLLFNRARNWMLFAWLFLSLGIILGSWWAYEELGWGGFWAWDPVENSSFMPWLAGTALLHCFKRAKPGTTMASWMAFLCLLSYSLCIFGTFLTRYGLVTSVHAFPEPGLSILFMVLIVLFWIIAAGLFIRRLIANSSSEMVANAKGSGILALVNWLFVILIAVILVGTLFPFLSSLFGVEKKTLLPEYFTKITSPFGLFLLVLMGVCPYFFRKGLVVNRRTILAGLMIGIAATTAVVLYFVDKQRQLNADYQKIAYLAIPCFIACSFVVIMILIDFVQPFFTSEPGAKSRRSLRWYGALIAHIGVVLMFAGIAGSEGLGYEVDKALHAGESFKLEKSNYTITYNKATLEKGPNFEMTVAELIVKKPGGQEITMKPAIAYYPGRQQTTTEPDIRRSISGDIYITLAQVSPNGNLVNIQVRFKPLINWLWLGSVVMMGGSIIVMISWLINRNKSIDKTENNFKNPDWD